MEFVGESFETLLRRAQEGCSSATDGLCRRYARPLRAYLRRRLWGELRRWYDTEDLAQSVFAEVMRRLASVEYRGEPAFRQWLFLKAGSRLAGKHRKHFGRRRPRREEHIPDPGALLSMAASPFAEASLREQRENVRAILDALDGTLREILDLRLWQGLTFGEIARRTGLRSAEAARKRFSRGLLQLHMKLRPR